MDIKLGSRWESLIEEAIASGRFETADDVVDEGLRLFEERERRLRRPGLLGLWGSQILALVITLLLGQSAARGDLSLAWYFPLVGIFLITFVAGSVRRLLSKPACGNIAHSSRLHRIHFVAFSLTIILGNLAYFDRLLRERALSFNDATVWLFMIPMSVWVLTSGLLLFGHTVSTLGGLFRSPN